MTTPIFISYCWEEPVAAIVRNWLYPSLADDYQLIIDINDCRYRDDIDRFEKLIGKADKIIAVLSEDYLFSEACMYELAMIFQNGQLKRRLYPIYIGDFPRGKSKYEAKLLKHWKDVEGALDSEFHELTEEDTYKRRKRKLQLIRGELNNIIKYIANINTITLSALSENNFSKLKGNLKGEQIAVYQEESVADIPI